MSFEINYALETKLGDGYYCKVYQARCLRGSGLTKAIKIIDSQKAKHERPSTEVDVLQKCSHPNIIALEEHYYKYNHKDSALVFRAYDIDLRQFLRRRRDTPDEFPPEHKRQISSGLWTGLAYLHSVSIVHRDVNPANVMLRYGLTIQTVLADMGLAADMSMPSSVAGDDEAYRNYLNTHVCNIGYIAPELLPVHKCESAAYDSGIDVWSAAVVTFEIVPSSGSSRGFNA